MQGSVQRWRGRCPETWAQAFLATDWCSLKPVLTSGPKSCMEQRKERGQGMGALRRVSHQPDPPSQGFPPSPSPVPTRRLTRAGHTPGHGEVSRLLSSPQSPCPPQLPWSAPNTPSCSQSFCSGDGKAGPAQERDQRDRGRGVSSGEGNRGSRGIWLPSLPSPEEALENTDNKNSCSLAKRKCHFYPGLVLGTTGATSPMGSGARGSSGQETGLDSTAWTPKIKGKRV